MMTTMATNPSYFDFDVTNDSLGSVVERRKKFLKWMGLEEEEEDHIQPKTLVSEAIVESCFNGASEDSIEAEKVSASSSGSSVELFKELSMRVDNNVATRRESSSMASSSDSMCCQVKETEKQSKGWFKKKLKSMSCIAGTTKIETFGENKASSSRVEVKHCKKQVKELSALYHNQDIKAHNGSISAMKFNGDGKFLATSGEDGVVRVWKVVEDKRSIQGRDQLSPSCMYFDVNDLSQLRPEMKTIESFKKASDSACVVFPPKAFRILEKPLFEFRGHTSEVLDISWSNDNYLLSASMDNTVRLWKIGCNACLGVFTHNSYVTSVQFNPVNENYFMSGSIDGKVRIWNISNCNVVDWADLKDIISAVCYRPDGQGGIIGSLTGTCRFFSMSGDYLELDSLINLHRKKKSSNRRITSFKFLPQDQNKVMVVSADSKVRILQGNNVIRKYKSVCNTRSHTSASLSSDGKHIVSACEDSSVYIFNNEESYSKSSKTKKIRSFERFSTDASVATTWCGFSDHSTTLPFASPSCLSISKGSATWPEENLPATNPLSTFAMNASHYKFLKSSYKRASSSLSWGMVIVTGGWDGRIRTFQNYGLPVIT